MCEQLESWALRAAELIQEYVDEAEASEGGLFEKTAVIEKSLLNELDAIMAGRPTWQAQAATGETNSASLIDTL